MKQKEGRDYLSFDACIAAVEPDGSVRLSSMSETIILSAEEFAKLVKFVAANKEKS